MILKEEKLAGRGTLDLSSVGPLLAPVWPVAEALRNPNPDRLVPVKEAEAVAPQGIRPQQLTVQDVFQAFGQELEEKRRAEHRVLAIEQAKALQSILLCRTQELGYHLWVCQTCGDTRKTFNACQNRHCPSCMTGEQDKWCMVRQQELLRVDYYHVILTVPHEVNVWLDTFDNRAVIYRVLFDATRKALQKVARGWEHWGAHPAALSVLHTWNQLLEDHLHTHSLVPGVGWSVHDPSRLAYCPEGTLVPKHALMCAFRQCFTDDLEQAYKARELTAVDRTSRLGEPPAFLDWLDRLRGKRWVLEIKPPILKASMTLEYLARYTQQTAIGNSRILAIDKAAGTVTFRYRDSRSTKNAWGEYDEKPVSGQWFIDHFLRHVLPYKFVRMRTWGFWSAQRRGVELPRIRTALGTEVQEVSLEGEADAESDQEQEEEQEAASESSQLRCSQCDEGTLELVLGNTKPSLGRIMDIQFWSGHSGWSFAGWKCTPRGQQQILPHFASFLPGGADHTASVAANRAVPVGHGSRDDSALGFP